MFNTFSVHRSVDAFKVLAAGVVSSLLVVQFSPTNPTRIEQLATTQLADSSSTTPAVVTQQVSKSTLLLIAGAAVGSIAVGLALKERGNRQESTRDNQKSSVISLSQASHKLQRKLLTLLHDDRDAAKRLLTQAQLKYPYRTTDWYVEKVIYDLERDRRA